MDLELVGTDRPFRAAAGVNHPLQLNTPQAQKQQAVNSQPTQAAIGQAGQRMAQPLQTASETVQLRTQQELAAIQAKEQSDLRANMAQAQKAAANGDAISALAQTASQYLLQRKQMSESKKLEAQRIAQEQAKALQDQRNEQTKQQALLLIQEAEKDGYKNDPAGTTAYKTKVQELLTKSGADEETRTAVLKMYVDSATAYDKQVNERLYADAKLARDKVTESAKAQLKFEMTAAMTELRENKFVNSDRVNALFNEQITKINERTDIGVAAKDELRAAAYNMFAQSLEGNVGARAKLDELQSNYNNYREAEYKIQEQVAAGTMPQSQANAQLANLRAFYGVSAADAFDPHAGLKQQREFQQLSQVPDKEVDRIREKVNQVVDTKFRMPEGDMGAAAYGLLKMNGGAGLADLRNKPASERTPLEQKLLNRAELLEKALNNQNVLLRKEQEYKQAIAKFQQSSIKDLLRQTSQGQVDNSFVQARIASAPDQATRDAILKAVGGQQLAPEDEAALESSRQEILSAMTQEAELNQQALLDARDTLADFGITGNPEKDGERLRNGMESFNKTLKLQTDERNRLTEQAIGAYNNQLTPGVVNPNAGGGVGQSRFPKDVTVNRVRSDLKRTTSFAKDSAGNLSPFPANVNATITSGHGARKAPVPGASTFHQGIDYGVPEGTPLHSMVDGVVVAVKDQGNAGYGSYITIKGADGMYYRYSHLKRGSHDVKVGDAIPAGAKFAESGASGIGTGAHLHLDIRTNDKYNREASVDPVKYMASANVRFTTSSPARNNKGQDGGAVLLDGANQLTTTMPKGAVPLANGGFIFNGQVFEGSGTPTTATFNGAKRMNNSWSQPLKPGEKVVNDVNKNHGYKRLEQDQDLKRALNETANSLGVKAEWLADIIAYESAGSFSSSIRGAEVPGQGRATGLIQFMPATLKSLGSSFEEASRMTPAQQMRTLVKRYFELGKKEVGGFKDVSEMYLYVFGGGSAVRRYRKNPSGFDTNDGYNNFRTIITKLGGSVGRQYAVGGNDRKSRIASATHTSYKDGCAVCENFRQANSPILPHEPQPLVGSVEQSSLLPQVPKQ